MQDLFFVLKTTIDKKIMVQPINLRAIDTCRQNFKEQKSPQDIKYFDNAYIVSQLFILIKFPKITIFAI